MHSCRYVPFGTRFEGLEAVARSTMSLESAINQARRSLTLDWNGVELIRFNWGQTDSRRVSRLTLLEILGAFFHPFCLILSRLALSSSLDPYEVSPPFWLWIGSGSAWEWLEAERSVQSDRVDGTWGNNLQQLSSSLMNLPMSPSCIASQSGVPR